MWLARKLLPMSAKARRESGWGPCRPPPPAHARSELQNPGFVWVHRSLRAWRPPRLASKTAGDLQNGCALLRGEGAFISDGTTCPAAAPIVLQGQMATLDTRDAKGRKDRSRCLLWLISPPPQQSAVTPTCRARVVSKTDPSTLFRRK